MASLVRPMDAFPYLEESDLGLQKSVSGKQYLESCELPRSRWPSHNGSGSFIEETNQWLAENALQFVNELYFFYAVASDKNMEWKQICNSASKGFPKNVEFIWKDRWNQKRNVNANEYASEVFLYIEGEALDQDMFPQDKDECFPPEFRWVLKTMFRRLFRVYAILLSNNCLRSRFENDTCLESLKQFLYFSWHWGILSENDTKGLITKTTKEIQLCYYRDRKKSSNAFSQM